MELTIITQLYNSPDYRFLYFQTLKLCSYYIYNYYVSRNQLLGMNTIEEISRIPNFDIMTAYQYFLNRCSNQLYLNNLGNTAETEQYAVFSRLFVAMSDRSAYMYDFLNRRMLNHRIINDDSPDSGIDHNNQCDDYYQMTSHMNIIEKLQFYRQFSLDVLINALSKTKYTILGLDISLLQLYPATIKSFIRDYFPYIDLEKFTLNKFNLNNYNLNLNMDQYIYLGNRGSITDNALLKDLVNHYKEIKFIKLQNQFDNQFIFSGGMRRIRFMNPVDNNVINNNVINNNVNNNNVEAVINNNNVEVVNVINNNNLIDHVNIIDNNTIIEDNSEIINTIDISFFPIFITSILFGLLQAILFKIIKKQILLFLFDDLKENNNDLIPLKDVDVNNLKDKIDLQDNSDLKNNTNYNNNLDYNIKIMLIRFIILIVISMITFVQI